MSGEDDGELDPGRALYQRLKREREAREREAAAQRAAAAAAPPREPQRTTLAPQGAVTVRSGQPSGQSAGGGQLPRGTLLNQIYEIRRYIASGGMGEVYEGVNTATDERVAIK